MSLVFASSFDPFRGFDLIPANASRKVHAPAYDLVSTGDDAFQLSVAVPGYVESELTLTVDDGTLIVRGEKAAEQAVSGSNWIRRGIARGTFEQRFALAEHVQVKGADLANGLLNVQLARVIPEALKPRTIAIGGGSPSLPNVAHQAA